MDSAAQVKSVVLGASGAIGGALVRLLKARGDTVWEFSRSGPDHTDICDEQTREELSPRARVVQPAI